MLSSGPFITSLFTTNDNVVAEIGEGNGVITHVGMFETVIFYKDVGAVL